MADGTAPEPARRRPGLWRFAISIAVSVALVAYLLRDISPALIATTIRDADSAGLTLGALAFLGMVAARVVRYRLLLSTPVPWLQLSQITMVRGMLGDLLPARLGTLSFVWLATARARVPLADALSAFLLALAFDMVAIAPMLLLAMAVVGFGIQGGATLAALATLLLAGSLAGVWLLAPALRFAAGIADRLAAGAGSEAGTLTGAGSGTAASAGAGTVAVAKLAATLGGAARDVAERVDEVRARGALAPVFLISILVRLTKFGAHWLLLQAVLVPLGIAWGSLGFFEAFLGIASAEMSAMLPISGIASFGTWEAAFTFAFTHLGLTEAQAIVSGFATHVLSQSLDYALGILALIALMRPKSRSRRGGRCA